MLVNKYTNTPSKVDSKAGSYGCVPGGEPFPGQWRAGIYEPMEGNFTGKVNGSISVRDVYDPWVQLNFITNGTLALYPKRVYNEIRILCFCSDQIMQLDILFCRFHLFCLQFLLFCYQLYLDMQFIS